MPHGSMNDTGFMTFTATAAAIAPYVRVQVDGNGLISAAGATDSAIGITIQDVAASGSGTVKLFSAPGTFLLTASAAVTRGAVLYPTASGRVDDTGTTALPFEALEAATAAGDVIECAVSYLGA